MVCATREAVARSLAEWRDMGIIATGRRTVVLDPAALPRLAANRHSAAANGRGR